LAVVLLSVIIISQWGLWETVIKPCVFGGARYHDLFPSPFYLWSWPIWMWNDLFLTLTIFSAVALTVLACLNKQRASKPRDKLG